MHISTLIATTVKDYLEPLLATEFQTRNLGDEFAIGEVGGGRTWLRRFTVEGSVFFTRTKDDRETANEIAGTIRGLVESNLSPEIVLGLEDEFGERAFRLIPGPSHAEERGGPKSHIWDFWVYFSVETVRPH